MPGNSGINKNTFKKKKSLTYWLSLHLKNDKMYELEIWHSGLSNTLDV